MTLAALSNTGEIVFGVNVLDLPIRSFSLKASRPVAVQARSIVSLETRIFDPAEDVDREFRGSLAPKLSGGIDKKVDTRL